MHQFVFLDASLLGCQLEFGGLFAGDVRVIVGPAVSNGDVVVTDGILQVDDQTQFLADFQASRDRFRGWINALKNVHPAVDFVPSVRCYSGHV